MAASREAQSRGICCEMTLAEACALCPNLEHGEYQPLEDRKGLVRLGRWMMRFSPIVALDQNSGCTSGASETSDALAAIFMDVTGCERLYGGLTSLMEQLAEALKRLRFHASLAIAPTPGAAFAIALAGRHGIIIRPENLSHALAGLPPDFLRIEPAIAEMLHHLGIGTIGQLMQLPRESLPARFGGNLLMRLDQALGRIEEPLVPLNCECPIESGIDFEGPIDGLETIWSAFAEMLKAIIQQLTARGCGARKMEIEFLRPYAPVISKTILLARPSRDGKNLFNLIRCAMETLEEEARRHGDTKARRGGNKWRDRSQLAHLAACEEMTSDGFIGLRVRVPLFERLTHEQVALMEHEEQAAQAEFDQLIERLCLRLGDESVVRPCLVESHIPEKAYICVAATSQEKHGHSRRAGNAHATSKEHWQTSCQWHEGTPAHATPRRTGMSAPPVRPIRLYETPLEIRATVSPSHDRDGRPISFTLGRHAHRLVHAIGPERIAGQWWEGHHKTRDYFIVEDEEGRRFWIFRVMQSSRWYMHGEFE